MQLSGGVVNKKALRPARGTLDDALAYHCGALIPATREESPHHRPPQPGQTPLGSRVSDDQRSHPHEIITHGEYTETLGRDERDLPVRCSEATGRITAVWRAG